MKGFIAETKADVVGWMLANSFHDGAIEHIGGQRGLMLRGPVAKIFIPNSVDSMDLYEPSDYAVTGKMFEPTIAGLEHLDPSLNRQGKPLLGFQIADATGANIQGLDADPTGLASFEIMPPKLALSVIAGHPELKLQAIFDGDIEDHVMIPENDNTAAEIEDLSP